MYQKGSLCLDDIPKEYISTFVCPDGKKKRYINFHIYPQKKRKETKRNGKVVVYTHELVLMPAKYGELEKKKIAEIQAIEHDNDKKQKTPKKEKVTKTKKQEPVNVFDYSAVDEDLF